MWIILDIAVFIKIRTQFQFYLRYTKGTSELTELSSTSEFIYSPLGIGELHLQYCTVYTRYLPVGFIYIHYLLVDFIYSTWYKSTSTVSSSVSDPHKFSCGSGSRILKMSIWIRIQTPNFLFGSGSKGGKN